MLNDSIFKLLRARGEETKDAIIAWRRVLHKIPELNMDTPKTEAEIVNILREIGITDIQSGVGGHGITAVIEGALDGKCLAIRADCDALPIKEGTELPFASENGNMHACGHDAHTAMALGAAKLIFENRHLLRGRVKFIFQPYEEGDGGAKLMIADGALENPKVDAIIALHNHCNDIEDYIPGDVLVTSEPITANIFSYEATFFGTTSHVCLASKAKNAVYMACNAVSEISKIESTSELVNAVTVVQGGVRNNIIPESALICGTIRAFDTKMHGEIKEKVLKILGESAKKFGGEVKVKIDIDLMATKNDYALYESFCKLTSDIYPERPAVKLKDVELIGEDFARFAKVVPGFYFKLHTKPKNTSYPLHHPKFDVNEDVLHKGSVLFAGFGLNWQNE